MDQRQQALQGWLKTTLDNTDFHLTPASSDASFRRYFRVHLTDQTLIAMDAPPEKEDCQPFVDVAAHLIQVGLNAPKLVAQDLTNGFLLMDDLGNQTYLAALNDQTAPALYQDATNALVVMQANAPKEGLPLYDHEMLMREMHLFSDWYVQRHLGVELSDTQQQELNKVYELLANHATQQTQVMVHRDYHARNLMVTQDNNPGVLDFQDAVVGPVTYDLVSLLRDAYIQWDESKVIDWAVRYWQAAQQAGVKVPEDFSEFYRDFEWMGAQRHLKVLGIFARLHYRDGKSNYLNDMPVVKAYLQSVCERYLELKSLRNLLLSFDSNTSE